MDNFSKKYKFSENEAKWQEIWQQRQVYAWDPTKSREDNYVIDTPPPTVSGQLHIGHIYSYTHTDFIARYQRMLGKNVFYPMGFDDNGLPTERLVEKKRQIKAKDISRAEFIKMCFDVIEAEEIKFRQLFKQVALSVDWQLEYQTISPTTQRLSQMSFLDLLAKGEIYQDNQPILWDPVDQTALAQADIEEQQRQTQMHHLRFKTLDEQELIIATTRPELLPAAQAIFYHPEDQRYMHLEGKMAITPLFNLKIPIIADELVDPEKGSGLVMCCTFGDQTDIIWWRKHQLATQIIINDNGTIKPFEFGTNCTDLKQAKDNLDLISGLHITKARAKIIELLQQANLIQHSELRTQTIKCAERSGAPLEIITTKQWFVRSVKHKEALLEQARQLAWHPHSMKIKLDSWIENISLDWCISRQRYFGVAFPVWYSTRAGEEGKIILATPDQLPVDPAIDLPAGYAAHEVVAETDVMDTWSTSAISPQLSSYGISENYAIDAQRHQKLFPADLRPQSHEILRTWAYYTLLKSYLHESSLPWRNIMISGWCLAADKSKMSKSKGNIIDPVNILEQYGADVTRYWAANSKLGVDTAYSEDVMKNGKRLVNKLWNAGKFISQHFDKINTADLATDKLASAIICDIDQYFLNELGQLVNTVTKHFDQYQYAEALGHVEHFFWQIFCDNYLEITKHRAYDETDSNPQGAKSARLSLYYGFKILLQLLAPFMPHITEELYSILYNTDSNSSIHQQGMWPKAPLNFNSADNRATDLLDILFLVRKSKAQENLSIKAPITLLEISGTELSNNLIEDLKAVTSSQEIVFCDSLENDGQKLILNNIKIKVAY